jgi:hypothetical protein
LGNPISPSKINETLEYNKTYSWRVKVWNDNGDSDWTIGPTITTIPHPYPAANFYSMPNKPQIGDNVRFCSVEDSDCPSSGGSLSIFYDTTHPELRSWTWNFTFVGGGAYSTTTSNPFPIKSN